MSAITVMHGNVCNHYNYISVMVLTLKICIIDISLKGQCIGIKALQSHVLTACEIIIKHGFTVYKIYSKQW